MTTLELLRGYRERVEAEKAFLENPTAVRDKCINRPLPHERMRPLLNDISVTTRDQLTAFFNLNNVAAQLEPFVPATPEPDPKRTLGRRELFNRIFKLPKD